MDKNEKQRIYRLMTGNRSTRSYEKTKNGFLMRTYRNMKSRCSGVTVNKNHLYYGKEIMEKSIFYQWALNDDCFNSLFKNWESRGYNRKETPSIDRIDTKIGYIISNVRWITHSENSRLGGLSKKIKK